jgi:alpha-L-arabinofuranosidase
VGNEMFGDWQLGHMPLSQYVQKHNVVADAIWKVDPSAQLVAVGNVGEWSRTMLAECADHMNFMSEHIYVKELPDVVQHAAQLKHEIHRVAAAHRLYNQEIPGLAKKPVRVAMDEWNYWYGDYIYGQLGVRYHMKDALGIAEGLHEYYRNSDLFFMANDAQTVNVIGCIKVTPTASAFESTGLVMEMYRHHYGSIPVGVSGEKSDLDVAAAWTDDRKALTLAIVNPDSTSQTVNADFGQTALEPEAAEWQISNPDPNSYNSPGLPQNISIQESKIKIENSSFNVPAYSVSLYRISPR